SALRHRSPAVSTQSKTKTPTGSMPDPDSSTGEAGPLRRQHICLFRLEDFQHLHVLFTTDLCLLVYEDRKSCALSQLGLNTGVEKMAASAATASSPPGLCPNYAVICSFLERYGALLDLPELTFPQLERYLQDTSSGRARKHAAGCSEDAERLQSCINDNGTELTC
ncbi:hypothetical protein XENOCAPTIV_000266, partial [Xenoophorus captivus]